MEPELHSPHGIMSTRKGWETEVRDERDRNDVKEDSKDPRLYCAVIMEGLRRPSGDKLRSCDSSRLPFIFLTLNQELLVKAQNKRKCLANQ